MSDGWSDYRRLYGQGEAQSGGPVSAPFANYQWPKPIVPRFYGEEHNARNLSELDAMLERHRGRHKPDPAREMLRADIGLPPMPDAFHAFWLGKDGCL